ncbi:MAG: metallophosphoesterase [Xanthomonadales bacterium]
MSRNALTDLRIIQLSDCHVSADRSALYRGVNAERNLAGLLPAIRRWQPDLILLTGDVSEDASAPSYGRVAALLDSLGSPVLALPGNHDDAAVMRRYFPRGPWDAPLFHEARGWQLVLLDSAAPGRIDGVLSRSQLQALKTGLQRCRSEHILVGLHHQPVPVGSHWIDRYALDDAEWLFGLLDRDPRIRCITFGHVHQAIGLERNGALLLGAPSSVANSLPGREKFTLDVAGPACRWLRLGAGGRIETGILHADPARRRD